MNADNDRDPSTSVADHIETEHYQLDLTTPPTRDDVGISDGSLGLTVYFMDDSLRTFRADLALPDDVQLSLSPRLVAIDTEAGLDRPSELTRETAPPGQVGLQFSFDDADQAEEFMRDLAGQLGDHRGGITDDYIAETLVHLQRGTRPPSPRIAHADVGYLTLEIQPRIGTAPEQGPHFLVDLHWSAMPDDGSD